MTIDIICGLENWQPKHATFYGFGNGAQYVCCDTRDCEYKKQYQNKFMCKYVNDKLGKHLDYDIQRGDINGQTTK